MENSASAWSTVIVTYDALFKFKSGPKYHSSLYALVERTRAAMGALMGSSA